VHRPLKLQAEPLAFAAMLLLLTVGINLTSISPAAGRAEAQSAPPARVATAN
jgi:hypothetical protein